MSRPRCLKRQRSGSNRSNEGRFRVEEWFRAKCGLEKPVFVPGAICDVGLKILRSERAPTTGRVSSRCSYWFAPHTLVTITDDFKFVILFLRQFQNFVTFGRSPRRLIPLQATNTAMSLSPTATPNEAGNAQRGDNLDKMPQTRR